MKLFRKKTKDPEKIKASNEKAFELGVKIGEKIHFSQFVKRMNTLGEKKPKKFFASIFIVMGISIFLPFIMTQKNKDNISTIIKNERPIRNAKSIMDANKQELDKTAQELAKLDSDATVLINKKEKTGADSLELGRKIQKIKALSKILDLKNNEKN